MIDYNLISDITQFNNLSFINTLCVVFVGNK